MLTPMSVHPRFDGGAPGLGAYSSERGTLSPLGHLNKAAFPEGVNAPAQYGPGVKAAAVYLKNYQFLPFERTCELLGDLFGCGISEGALANILASRAQQLKDG